MYVFLLQVVEPKRFRGPHCRRTRMVITFLSFAFLTVGCDIARRNGAEQSATAHNKQAEAVAAIRRWGGDVRCHSYRFGPPINERQIFNDSLGKDNVVIAVYNSASPHRALDMTDDRLRMAAELPDLRLLQLGSTKITDAGMRSLRGLTFLEDLDLSNTRITDQGLADLEALTHLQSLQLQHTAISDAGLAHLCGLRELEELFLQDTKVTLAGINKLKRAVPNLRVVSSCNPTAGAEPDAPKLDKSNHQARYILVEYRGQIVKSGGHEAISLDKGIFAIDSAPGANAVGRWIAKNRDSLDMVTFSRGRIGMPLGSFLIVVKNSGERDRFELRDNISTSYPAHLRRHDRGGYSATASWRWFRTYFINTERGLTRCRNVCGLARRRNLRSVKCLRASVHARYREYGFARPMSPTAENTIERLDAMRQRWWLFSLLSTMVLAVSLSFGIFLAMMLADALTRLPQAWLLAVRPGVAGCHRRAGLQRGPAAAPRPAEHRGHRPPRRGRIPRTGQQPDQPGPTCRRPQERQPGVLRSGHQPGGRPAGPASPSTAPPTSESRWRRLRTACRRRATWPNRSAILAVLIVAAVVCEMLDSQLGFGGVDGCWPLGRSSPRSDRSKSSALRRAIPTCWSARASKSPRRSRIPQAKPHRGLLWVAPAGEQESPHSR